MIENKQDFNHPETKERLFFLFETFLGKRSIYLCMYLCMVV